MKILYLRRLLFFITVLLFLAASALPEPTLAACNPNAPVTLVSASIHGGASDQGVVLGTLAISGDGRYIAYTSSSTDLVPGDTNSAEDVFVYDRLHCTNRRVSVSSNGQQANLDSYGPALSTDGRYVAFSSDATNLVPGDTDGNTDVFVRDLVTNQVTLISVGWDGTASNGDSYGSSLSADGRYVGFGSYATNLVPNDTNNHADAFVYDRQTGQTTRVSVATDGTQGDLDSGGALISGDGSIVTFESDANNLIPNDQNLWGDTFVHNMQTGETVLASFTPSGFPPDQASNPTAISEDGKSVLFETAADNLINPNTFLCSRGNFDCYNLYIYHVDTHQITQAILGYDAAQPQPNGSTWQGSLSADGKTIVFSSIATNLTILPTGQGYDIFSSDHLGLDLPVTDKLYPTASDYGGAYPVVSADGHYLAYFSVQAQVEHGHYSSVYDVFVAPVPTIDFSQAPTLHYFTTSQVVLTWSAVTNATNYEVQIAYNAAFQSPVWDYNFTYNYLSATRYLSDGTYYWRVRALQPNGIWGDWSTPESLTVKTR